MRPPLLGPAHLWQMGPRALEDGSSGGRALGEAWQVAGKRGTRGPQAPSRNGWEELGLSSVRHEPCMCVLWGAKWGAPKNKKQGVQGIPNHSVTPQDRELRPEEIEGKGFGEELAFLVWWVWGCTHGKGGWLGDPAVSRRT